MTYAGKWMELAWQRLGVAEIAGPGAHNDEIVSWWRIIGLPGVKDDETPNCGAFVGAMLTLAGVSIAAIPVAERGRARAYAKLGVPCELKPGAIGIIRRDEAGPDAGHVFFVAAHSSTHVTGIGANQDDKVCAMEFPIAGLVAVRWPEVLDAVAETPPAAEVPVVPEAREQGSRSWLELLSISRTVRGALHAIFGGLLLFFDRTLELALDTAARIAELEPLKPMLTAAGANLDAIGLAFLVWGATWVVIAKLTPKPARPA